MNTRSIINEIVRDKNVTNDIGYCILHIFYVLLFKKIYIPNKYIAIELSEYA